VPSACCRRASSLLLFLQTWRRRRSQPPACIVSSCSGVSSRLGWLALREEREEGREGGCGERGGKGPTLVLSICRFFLALLCYMSNSSLDIPGPARAYAAATILRNTLPARTYMLPHCPTSSVGYYPRISSALYIS
jgi:hypothetical protein